MATVSGALSAAEKSMRSVFVGNISYDASEELLQEIFGQVGPVLKFKLVYDRETGKPKGYGFCEYKDQETALSAMRNLNGYELNGRTLRVDHAASEKNKEELKQLQQALGGPRTESLYGEVVHPEQAPEAISKAVASLPPEQMFELMKQMKLCIQNNPNEARNMLLQNPQLAYALLQAQVIMKVIDPKVAVAMLHRQRDQIPPIVLNEQQNPPPPAVQSPMSAPMTQSPLQQQSPHFSQADIDQDMRLQQRSGMFGGPPQPGFGPPPASGPSRGPGMKPSLLGDRPPGPEPLLGDPRGPRMGPPANMRPPFPGGGAPLEEMPRLDAPVPPSSRPGPLDPRARGVDPRDPRGMPADPRAMSADPRGMPTSMAGDIRPIPADPRAMANDARSMGGPMPRDPRAILPGRNAPAGPMGAGAVGAAAAGFLAAGGVAGPPQPTSTGGITQQDQEKAALIMQVLQLTDQQIAMLPVEQRQSILILKEQIARSSTRE